MKLCFMEGCDQEAQVTVEKTVHTRGHLGNSSCKLSLPFCSVDHAVAFERLYHSATEQLTTIARLAANFESRGLTIEQLENATRSLAQSVDINLGNAGMVILSRAEFEELQRARRMLASTQRQLNEVRRDHARCPQQGDK
jgi:hypothetical protein